MEPIHRLDRAQLPMLRFLVWLPMTLLGIAMISIFIYRGGASAEWLLLVAGAVFAFVGGVKLTLARELIWRPDRRMVTESRSVLLFAWRDHFDLSSFDGVELKVQLPDAGEGAANGRRKFRIFLQGVRSVEVGEFEEPAEAAECAKNAAELLNLPVNVVETDTI